MSHPTLTATELENSLELASRAQSQWKTSALEERSVALRRLAGLLRDEVEVHARRMSLEMGKPIVEARGEILKCATACEYYADHVADILAPRQVQTEAVESFVAYEPLGVVLAIMPWNFPFWQVIRFAAPALAAGNGGLLKHASNVTGSALAIQDLIERAGFPVGLFTTLVTENYEQVYQVIADPRVAAVTLTGSEKAGALVAEAAGRALKKCVLELGGSDPFVVRADADLNVVVPAAVKARFMNAGQSCICAKRHIVDASRAESFEFKLLDAVEALKVGDPLEESTQLGPLARPEFVDDIDRQVHGSIRLGARLVTGGYRLPGPGNYYAPTILADVTPGMPAFDEETFGPVLVIVKSTDDDDAARLANATKFGLGASVWSADREAGLALGRRIESGALFVNGIVASDPRLPFGGIKHSGYGRELSAEGLREFTNQRTYWVGDLA
jgi:succinate-semialdehyde dehydrogenase/glutarate-semialdehyde dehydrogenase